MSKKSIPRILKFLNSKSLNTQKGYLHSIKKYEEFHGTSMESLICEALDEQTERVPYHLLKVVDRIEEFQESLIEENLTYNTVQAHVSRIKHIYKRNRVDVPSTESINPRKVRRRDVIEYKDILTKEEIKQALPHLQPPSRARAMVMAQGGLTNRECDELKLSSFIEETHHYHQCDNVINALRWLSDENHPIIWITRIVRVKTGKPYYCLIGAEAVNMIAKAKLWESEKPMYKDGLPDKLLNVHKESFSRRCREVNKICGFGKVAEEVKFRGHMLRKFNATNINGSALTYEEHSKLSYAEIDEMQGRGKTSVQDTYIKTNPLQQKLLYAKVMNNVCLYNQYDYEITDDDVILHLIDPTDENKKLKREVKELNKKLEKRKKASEKVKMLREEMGNEEFEAMIGEILNAS